MTEIEIAKEYLGTENILSREIHGINGWYFWEPIRGGRALIIDGSGNKLGATSSVGFKRHLEEFCRRYR